MGFIEKEKSLIESRPEELYLFTLFDSYLAQCSGTQEITWDSKVWEPIGISRSSKSLTSNSLKSKLTLQTTMNNPFVTPFLTCAPDLLIKFTLYRGQWGNYIPYFRGFIELVSFKTKTVEITCSPMTSRLKRMGLQRKFSRSCEVPLYSSLCRLTESGYQITGTVDSVSGLSIVSSAFDAKADGYFKGGWIEVNNYSRMIVYHVGSTVKINSPIPDLVFGFSFVAKMGCGHSLNDCIALANSINFQGHAWISYKNPFTGDAIV